MNFKLVDEDRWVNIHKVDSVQISESHDMENGKVVVKGFIACLTISGRKIYTKLYKTRNELICDLFSDEVV